MIWLEQSNIGASRELGISTEVKAVATRMSKSTHQEKVVRDSLTNVKDWQKD